METITRAALVELAQAATGHRVSIYLPTHRRKELAGENPIRLKNLLARAEEELVERGVRPVEARDMLAAPRALAADGALWREADAGLALFVERGGMRAIRLGTEVEEAAWVEKRYVLAPAVPALAERAEFYVLVASQSRVRLLHAVERTVAEVDAPHLPANLETALNLQPIEAAREQHGRVTFGKDSGAAVFHGQGAYSEHHKDEIANYFREVERALEPVLRERTAPLVFAGVDYLAPLFRKACRYPHLAEAHLAGNFDRASAEEVRAAAWRLLEPELTAPRRAVLRAIWERAETDPAVCDLGQILPRVTSGRVAALAVNPRVQSWGTFDAASGEVQLLAERRPEAEDLVNRAVVEGLTHDAALFATARGELPGEAAVAATWRY